MFTNHSRPFSFLSSIVYFILLFKFLYFISILFAQYLYYCNKAKLKGNVTYDTLLCNQMSCKLSVKALTPFFSQNNCKVVLKGMMTSAFHFSYKETSLCPNSICFSEEGKEKQTALILHTSKIN